VNPSRAASLAACVLAIATAVVAVRYGVFVAAGSDSYGYVSQSELWATGGLRVAQPVVLQLPAALTDDTLAPLGYRPARRVGLPGGIVPTYPPGLPIAMAAFRLVAGRGAVYFVVPLLAALTVWCTYLLGRRLAGSAAGLAASCLLAASPAFVTSAIQPMSDVPAAAWWALAVVLAARAGPWSAAGSGAAAAAAVLTRPNLAPVGVVLGLWFLAYAVRSGRLQSREIRRLLAYAVAALPGPLAIAAIQYYLYKSPFQSGYDPVGAIYAWKYVAVNLERYPRWIVETRSAFIFLAAAGPFVCSIGAKAIADAPQQGQRAAAWSRVSLAWLAAAVAATICAGYLPYMPFLDWTYLRFLVPAFPAAFALASAAVAVPLARFSKRASAIPLAVVVAVLVPLQLSAAADRGVFRWREGAERHKAVGRYLDARLSPKAVLFSMQLSGSARFYGHRLTVRYDQVPPQQLDAVVSELVARGFHPYFLLEDWEEARFRSQFAAASSLGTLNWPPSAETTSGGLVRLYDPLDAAGAARGERVRTAVIR
jgi:asparagine N-glycosylation enzyme membrane subunit Stt3